MIERVTRRDLLRLTFEGSKLLAAAWFPPTRYILLQQASAWYSQENKPISPPYYEPLEVIDDVPNQKEFSTQTLTAPLIQAAFIIKDLKNKGELQYPSGKGLYQDEAEFHRLLSNLAVHNHPISIGDRSASSFAQLISTSNNGEKYEETRGRVICYGFDMPPIQFLQSGDTLCITDDESISPAIITVLDTSRIASTGEHVALIARTRKESDEFEIAWFNDLGMSMHVRGTSPAYTSIVRDETLYYMQKQFQSNILTFNKQLQDKTEPDENTRYWPYSLAQRLAQSLSYINALTAPREEREQYFPIALEITRTCDEPEDTVGYFQTIDPTWLPFGMREILLNHSIMSDHPYNAYLSNIFGRHIPPPEQIVSHIDALHAAGYSLYDVIKGGYDTSSDTDILFLSSNDISKLYVGDIVLFDCGFETGHTLMAGSVIHTAVSNDNVPEVRIMFYDWKGTGKTFHGTYTSIDELVFDVNPSGPMEHFGIVRSEMINNADQIHIRLNRALLNSYDLPVEIQRAAFGQAIDPRSIPEIKSLQDALWRTTNIKERGDVTLSLLAKFGVETVDRIEYDIHKTQFYLNDWQHGPNLCNYYSAMVAQTLLGPTPQISHWINQDGVPFVRKMHSKDRELSASGMNWWLHSYGNQYGWNPVTHATLDERMSLLSMGFIFYFAEYVPSEGIGDTAVIFGMENDYGSVIPVVTRATHNHLAVTPYHPYFFHNPSSYFEDNSDWLASMVPPDFDPLGHHVLWAHAPYRVHKSSSKKLDVFVK